MAAPALAVSGALVAAPQVFAAAPQAHAAVLPTKAVATQATTVHVDAAVRRADQAVRTYTVRPGNTLSGIAQRFYGHASDWAWLEKINSSKISNPDLIFAGEVLRVPTDPPASVRNGTYRPRHAKTAAHDVADVTPASPSSGSSPAGATGAVQQDIADGNNLLAIGQYLVAHGYSDAAAAGIASCVDGESRGNPESVGDGGGGLIGWTPLSSAAPNPNIVTGNVEQDMMTQLADILFYDSNEIGQSQVDQLNSISDPVAAADFFSQNFERPAVPDSDVVASVAEQIYAALAK